ncbi:UNVERIFIED_CONTAM: hypothetical protein RMT77_007120 [Armadillidium vulgare]
MFLTRILLKKAKSKVVVVEMESLVSGYKFLHAKLRGSDKVECLAYDPIIKGESVYVEKKKLSGVRFGRW